MKKIMKNFSLFLLIVVLAATLPTVTTLNSKAASKKPSKIILKTTSNIVDIKGKITVSVKSVKPKNTSKAVTYKSCNKKIATITSKGIVTGKKKGTVKIIAISKSNKKVKATIKLTVKDLKATSLKLNKTHTSLLFGKSTSLKATVKGSVGFYNQGVIWKSSNTKIATVTSKGIVKGISAGQATITATERGGQKKATCKVKVEAPVTPDEPNKPDVPDKPDTPDVPDKPDTPDEPGTYSYISAADLKADIEDAQEYKLLDTRKADDYAAGHIIGSISTDMNGILSGTDESGAASNIAKAISGDSASQKYAIICYSGNSYAQAAKDLLIKQGIKASNIAILTGGMKEWPTPNYLVNSYTSSGGFHFTNGIAAKQLKTVLADRNAPFAVFDLRSNKDYEVGHLKSAFSTPLCDDERNDISDEKCKAVLQAHVKILPHQFYTVLCYSGNYYANKAVNYLKELGVSESKIIVIDGGANALAALPDNFTGSSL